ncbi:MAG: type VI secretion system tube protein Hcp [Patescibacteria group bacterium]
MTISQTIRNGFHRSLALPVATAVGALLIGLVFIPNFGAIGGIEIPHATAAAVDYFLKIPDISGESTAEGHRNEIEIFSWSWGMSQTGSQSVSASGGASSGKVKVHDIAFTKRVDAASPKLMLACASGQHLKEMTITVLKTESEQPMDYLKYSFFDVFCTSLQTSAGSGDPIPTESISFNFAAMKIEYTKTDEAGRPGETLKAGWNFEQGRQF